MSTLTLLAATTVTVSLVSLIPQLTRVLRTRVTDGLSAGTIALTLASYTLWGTYGLGISDPTQIVNNALGLAVFAFLAHAVVVNTRATGGRLRTWHMPALVAGTAAAAATASVVSSPMAAAAAGTVLGFVTKIPQVRVALSGQPLWGLDPWAILLAMASILLWLTYGVMADDKAVIVSCAVAAALHTIVMWRRLPPRRTLDSIAGGRLGPHVARLTGPVAARFPYTGPRYADTLTATPGTGAAAGSLLEAA